MKSPISYTVTGIFVIAALIYSALFGSSESLEATPSPVQSPSQSPTASPSPTETVAKKKGKKSPALRALNKLPIKGRAPATGYAREQFADDWDYSFGCDTRNKILRRDLSEFNFRSGSSCIIENGILEDPFTGQVISFQRGVRTSLDVQIDHVVSLSDAWQKGAQSRTGYQRFLFYNDPLNLLAVWGPANSSKRDSDAASWLPPNKGFRCPFVARQIAVKGKYDLWVTQAEHDAMRRVLASCPKQKLPQN